MVLMVEQMWTPVLLLVKLGLDSDRASSPTRFLLVLFFLQADPAHP